MGKELYCGKPGTVNVWNNTVDYWELKNVAPEELGKYMYNDVMQMWPDLKERMEDNPNNMNPMGLFIEHPNKGDKPVRSYNELQEYACMIRKNWERSAHRKVKECRDQGIEDETIHLMEFEVEGDKLHYKRDIIQTPYS